VGFYGFNGMEADHDMKHDMIPAFGGKIGIGNSYTTEFRGNDPRLGRWWSCDPVVKPWISPYASNGNNPVNNIDPTGLDEFNVNITNGTPEKISDLGGNKTNYFNIINNEGDILHTEATPGGNIEVNHTFDPKSNRHKVQIISSDGLNCEKNDYVYERNLDLDQLWYRSTTWNMLSFLQDGTSNTIGVSLLAKNFKYKYSLFLDKKFLSTYKGVIKPYDIEKWYGNQYVKKDFVTQEKMTWNNSINRMKFWRGIGLGLNFLGMGASAFQLYTAYVNDDYWGMAEGSTDLAFSAIGFMGPTGTMISATYFITKPLLWGLIKGEIDPGIILLKFIENQKRIPLEYQKIPMMFRR
jgi:RHS repeat-associated protein